MQQTSQMGTASPPGALDPRAEPRAPLMSDEEAKGLVQLGTWTIVAGMVVGLAAVALIVLLPKDGAWLLRLMGVIWTSAAAGSFVRGGRALRAVGREPSAGSAHLLSAAKALAGGASSVAAALIAAFFLLR